MEPSRPFAGYDNIPWHDPDFGERMLTEHLDQGHDLASRRSPIIEEQVRWIHENVLGGESARILDLACGPGLYANLLTGLGHEVTGIDVSPASIVYARDHSNRGAIFIEGDIRDAEYGSGYRLVMLLSGEFNVFSPDDAATILSRASQSLLPGGTVLLEVNSADALRRRATRDFRLLDSGLFATEPHLLLEEGAWHADQAALVTRYTVIRLKDAGIRQFGASYQSYLDFELAGLLSGQGFEDMNMLPDPDPGFEGFMVTASKAP
jgi:SAM-dependent methyltransferase